LERAGVEFIDENGGSPGVRLRKRSSEKSRKSEKRWPGRTSTPSAAAVPLPSKRWSLVPVRGLQPRDLIQFIGSRNRVHEVLNRRRPLTLKMTWRLHQGLGIREESLIKLKQNRST
jgi:antitoxin component HigA of HigAB toxin-antitoxin module